jgi:hypothetical protein
MTPFKVKNNVKRTFSNYGTTARAKALLMPKKGDTMAEENPKLSSDFKGLLHMDY